MKRLLVTAAVIGMGVVGGTGAAVASSTVQHKPSKAPVVAGLRVTPDKLVHGGGQVKVSARVARATKCELSGTPKVAGLPVTFRCAGGTVARTVTLPADVSTTAHRYTVTLVAIGPHGRSHPQHASVVVAGKPKPKPVTTSTTSTTVAAPPVTSPPTAASKTPTVLYLNATPRVLDRPGGVVTITGDTYNPIDDNCALVQVSGPAVTVDSGQFGLIACNEPITVVVTIPVEPVGTGGTIFTFALCPDVSGHGGGLPNAAAVIVSQYGL